MKGRGARGEYTILENGFEKAYFPQYLIRGSSGNFIKADFPEVMFKGEIFALNKKAQLYDIMRQS